jgi:hypothetical protein
MIKIAHRGNRRGSILEYENSPVYITGALDQGYHCEVDVRYIDGKYYLGHDYPQYVVDKKFLKDDRLWCHAKYGTTLRMMLKDKIHCFFDNNKSASYTLTSKNYIWHWDGEGMIYVMDEKGLVGICSDYVFYLW